MELALFGLIDARADFSCIISGLVADHWSWTVFKAVVDGGALGSYKSDTFAGDRFKREQSN
jgi:hypothetical protein